MAVEIKNSLLIHKLNLLRKSETPREEIREILSQMAFFMVVQLLEREALFEKEINTWLGKGRFGFLEEERFLLVPILRAGVPMLEGASRALPGAPSGFLAMKRDEESLEAKVYYSRMPSVHGRWVIILDPMLATGGTLELALKEILPHKPLRTTSLHVIAAPEGIKRIESRYPEHEIRVVKIDKGLNNQGFIVPGLGDMGDRLYS